MVNASSVLTGWEASIQFSRLAEGRPKAYTFTMDFEWDEIKSEACFHRRGFDFAYAAKAFADPDRTIEIDDRRDYREERFRLTGNIKGRLYVVVFTPRHDVIRIISARKANQREIKRYEDSAHED